VSIRRFQTWDNHPEEFRIATTTFIGFPDSHRITSTVRQAEDRKAWRNLMAGIIKTFHGMDMILSNKAYDHAIIYEVFALL